MYKAVSLCKGCLVMSFTVYYCTLLDTRSQCYLYTNMYEEYCTICTFICTYIVLTKKIKCIRILKVYNYE